MSRRLHSATLNSSLLHSIAPQPKPPQRNSDIDSFTEYIPQIQMLKENISLPIMLIDGIELAMKSQRRPTTSVPFNSDISPIGTKVK
ncbi:uncharacterized protein G2W53_033705 [Senna tora]|uniref:Uncharacterized protein n=1 Tax=Senna tora TaxID=362788 RepID=A0A834T9X9_9FABA|nr:uncharacterized protein G2W53_033705 [Senna tora]